MFVGSRVRLPLCRVAMVLLVAAVAAVGLRRARVPAKAPDLPIDDFVEGPQRCRCEGGVHLRGYLRVRALPTDSIRMYRNGVLVTVCDADHRAAGCVVEEGVLSSHVFLTRPGIYARVLVPRGAPLGRGQLDTDCGKLGAAGVSPDVRFTWVDWPSSSR